MKSKIDLTKGNVLKGLLIVAIPILLTSFFELAYNMTDIFWLGRIGSIGVDSVEAIAGVGIAGYPMWFGAGLFLLTKIGVSIKVANHAGANQEDKVVEYGRNGVYIAMLSGFVYGILIILLSRQIIGVFKIYDGNVFTYARNYMYIVAAGCIFFFVNPTFAGIYNSLGKSYMSLIIGGLGTVLNIILDPILMIVLKMGIEGAALATIISQFTVTCIFFISLVRKKSPIRFGFGKKPNLTRIKEIWKLSFPTALNSIVFTIIAIIVARQVSSFGPPAIAAQKVGNQIESMVWLVGGGMQVAIVAFVGQNYGAKLVKRIKEGCRKSIIICLAYGVLMTLLLWFGSKWLMNIFIPGQTEAIEEGAKYLKILATAELINLLEAASSGIFNGMGHTKTPATLSIIGNVIRIPLVFILVPVMGLNGVWWTCAISMLFKGIANFSALLIFFKKKGLIGPTELVDNS